MSLRTPIQGNCVFCRVSLSFAWNRKQNFTISAFTSDIRLIQLINARVVAAPNTNCRTRNTISNSGCRKTNRNTCMIFFFTYIFIQSALSIVCSYCWYHMTREVLLVLNCLNMMASDKLSCYSQIFTSLRTDLVAHLPFCTIRSNKDYLEAVQSGL